MEIVRANAGDYEALLELFDRYGFALTSRGLLDWKLHENPAGDGAIFKLIVEGCTVGTIGVIPQIFWLRGESIAGLQVVDGLMGREVRGKRLFHEVMVAARRLGPPGSDGDTMHVGFPSLEASVRSFERAGWRRVAGAELRTCLFTPSKLEKVQCVSQFAPVLARMWGVVRALLFRGADDDIVVEPTANFLRDMNQFNGRTGLWGDRSAGFLNWRVVNNPRGDLRAFSLIKGGCCVGYAVCKVTNNSWELVEFRGANLTRRHFATFARYLYQHGLTETLDIWLFGREWSAPWVPRWGVARRRSSAAVFVSGGVPVSDKAEPTVWNLSYLDSDW